MHLRSLTMGRIGSTSTPCSVGVGLHRRADMGKHLGGSPTNVAVAAMRGTGGGRRS